MMNAVSPPRARRRGRTKSLTTPGSGGTAGSEAESTGQQPGGVTDTPSLDRSAVIGQGLRATAGWALRLIVIGVASGLLLWLLAQIWVGILPVLLALILSTVLWRPVAWLSSRRVPPALAAAAVLGTSLLALGGVFAVVAKPVVSQSVELASSAVRGIETVRNWLSGPPVNLASEQIDQGVTVLAQRLQSSASQIASGVFTGVSALTSGLVTAVLVVVLTFFFLKDGPAFLPWIRRETGPKIGGHLTEAFSRCGPPWATSFEYKPS
jgi:predicted PurR-regulated permease PerM